MRSYQLPMLIEIKPCIILGRIDCRLASHASVGRIQVLLGAWDRAVLRYKILWLPYGGATRYRVTGLAAGGSVPRSQTVLLNPGRFTVATWDSITRM